MNNKKIALSILSITIILWVMDFLIHGVLLMPIYEETPQVWRPMAEMSPLHGLFALLVSSSLFVFFYHFMIKPKSLNQDFSVTSNKLT